MSQVLTILMHPNTKIENIQITKENNVTAESLYSVQFILIKRTNNTTFILYNQGSYTQIR